LVIARSKDIYLGMDQNITLSYLLSLSGLEKRVVLSLLSNHRPFLSLPPFIKLANFSLLGFLGSRWIIHHGFLLLLSQEQLEALGDFTTSSPHQDNFKRLGFDIW
jgi:hypothetical protein